MTNAPISNATTLQERVNLLLDKAVRATDSQDALRFSQAALNASHTSALLDLGATRANS